MTLLADATPEKRAWVADRIEQLAAQARDATSNDELAKINAQIAALGKEARAGRWEPYPWQRPHQHPPGWTGLCTPSCADFPTATVELQGMWLMLGGRGTGKSEGAARYVNDHVKGPPCDTRLPGGHRLLIVAPTQGDAMEAVRDSPSSLKMINPSVRVIGSSPGASAVWTTGRGAGTRMRMLGCHGPDDVERLRAAGNTCLIWMEELAAQRHLGDALHHTSLGLRLGHTPHYVGSTTPKPRVELTGKRDKPGLMGDPRTILTRGRTQDATGLDPLLRDFYEARYGGTTLGRQELGGEVLEDIEGALWIHDSDLAGLLDNGEPDDRPGVEQMRMPVGSVGWVSHVRDTPTILAPLMVHRLVVSVDPSGGGHDEAGIVVVGAIGGHSYTLADLSGQMSSDRWARVAVQAYYDFGAEGIVLDKYGGDNPAMVIKSVTLEDGRTGAAIPIFYVPTKVGKRLRAEPVQAVSQQRRTHLVGAFPELEGQLTGWVPDEFQGGKVADSPDRLDAWVQANTYLLIRAVAGSVSSPVGTRMPQPVRKPGN